MNRIFPNRTLLTVALLAASAVAGGAIAAPQQATQQAAGNTAQAKHQDGRMGGHGGHHRGGRHGGGLEHMIQRMDSNNDGKVTRTEFDAAQAQRKQRMEQVAKDHPQARERMQKSGRKPPQLSFDAIDSKRQGYITRADVVSYEQAQRPLREAEARKRAAEKFAAADLNRDGKLSRVEVSQGMPRLESRFTWIDSNQDGFLTQQELQAGRKQR